MDKDDILTKKINKTINDERYEFPEDEPKSFKLINIIMILLGISVLIGLILSIL
ncbi:hypothetical protein [Gemelliphila palaticanis]|uniref:Uncharacterized protein n=1 Tax=Gemelliphila palaticanis TaxID=81950 RepID=A0ABX2T0U8_9BACL|nr:hypothetical protein [Gemella palaticanis]MBF0716092.1 hypothetical protein [Gemella palaticanis]NYS48022.1 hypothetical protein [Gemella palaticanis]